MSTMIHTGVPRMRRLFGPEAIFGTSLAATAGVCALAVGRMPVPMLLPFAVTTLFVLAGVVALLASLRRDPNTSSGVTYWDAAGALTLIGVLAAAAIEPDQIVGLIEGARHDR